MTPLGPWYPDQPDYREPSLIEAKNMLPRDDGAYGPMPGLSAITGVLPARALGMGSSRSTAGIYGIFAGTASHLYQLQGDGSWLQVSKSGGYTLDVGNGDRPRGVQYGDRYISAMGISNPVQSFNVAGGSQFADLDAATPRALHIAVVREFIVLGNTWDTSQGFRPDQLWWSAFGNAASWPAPGSPSAQAVQSDRQILADGGHVQGIAAGIGGADAAVFGENRIWRMAYEGPPTIFRFDAVERARGCYASGSIVTVGKLAYYLSVDGWYVFDGVQSTPIGAGKVDRWFLADLDDSWRENIYAAADVDRHVIFWAYPGQGNSNGLPNRILAHNYVTGEWSRGDLALDCMAPLASVGYTLEGLDVLGYSLDTLPFSLDSRIWAGGGGYVGMVRASDHKLCAFSTSTMQADFTAAEISGPNGSRIWIDGARIYSDAPTVQTAIGWRDTAAGAINQTSYVTQDEDICDHLVATRYGRLYGRIPAGTVWTNTQGYELKTRPEGRR